MEVGPLRIHLIIGSNKAGAGSLLFDFKDDGSLSDLRDRAITQFEQKWPDCNFSDALLTVRDGPSLLPEATIFNQMRDRKKANKPMEMNLTIDDKGKEEPLDTPVREVSHSISVHAATNVDQLNTMLTNNEELIAAWQGYDTAVIAMEAALTNVKTHMSAFARTHALLTPQLVKGFFEVLRRFPTRDTGKPFVDVLSKTAQAGVEPIKKDHREYQAALSSVDIAQKKLALIQKENVKGKTSNERQVVKLTEALRECERATTAVNIPKLQYQSKLQDLQFTRALAVLELMASLLSVRATQHATCKGLMDAAGKEGKDLLAVSKKRQEEFLLTKERNFEKIQQSMVFQSQRGVEIMDPGMFTARMMFVVTPILPSSLVGEIIKRRLAQAIFLDADRFIPGELILTRYRLAFVAYSFSKAEAPKIFKPGEAKTATKIEEPKTEMEMIFSVPLVSLLRIDELEQKMFILTCKDLSTLSVSLIHCTKPEGPPLISGENKADQYSVYNPAFWTEVRSFAFEWPFYAFEYCTKYRSLLAAPSMSPSSGGGSSTPRNNSTSNGSGSSGMSSSDSYNEDGWGVYAPVAEWSRLSVPNKYFRLSQINNDYSFAPTYPRWLVFPADVDDNFMSAAGPFRSKNRCPTLHWCMRRRGSEGPAFVGIYGCSQPKVGFQGHRNPWDENLLDFCSGADKGANDLPERPRELKQSATMIAGAPGPNSGAAKKAGHHKSSSAAWEVTASLSSSSSSGSSSSGNGKSRLFPWMSSSSAPKPKAHTTKHPSNYVDVDTYHQYLKLQSSSLMSPYNRVILLEKPNTSFPYYDIAADDDMDELKMSVWESLHDLPHPETLKDMKPEARFNFVMDYLQKSTRETSIIHNPLISTGSSSNGGSGGGERMIDEDYFDEDEDGLENMDPEERAAYEHIKKLNEQQPLDKSHTRPAVIVDCRPYINAVANVAKGYGWENTALYKRCSVKFLGIPNIHVMRECMTQLRSLFLSMLKSESTVPGQKDNSNNSSGNNNTTEEADPYRHITLELRNNVDGCKWFKWLSLILEGAVGCVRHLLDGKPVIVHCSDGWDRTPQIIALTVLMLDPYFRTIRGLAVLIEKEFLSYGHKFADRMGHETDRANPKVKERSPVFLQWLDCVYQLVYQFPTHFEYDGRLLARLADHIFSCKYGTFFANSEKDRMDDQITTRTVSAWTPVLGNIHAFRSPHYGKVNSRENSMQRNSVSTTSFSSSNLSEEGGLVVQESDVLIPKCGVADMVLFTEFYQRWDPRKTASCSLLTSYEYTATPSSPPPIPAPVSSMPPLPQSAPGSLPQSITSVQPRALPSALLRSIAQAPPRLPPAVTVEVARPPVESPRTASPPPSQIDFESIPRGRSGPSFGSAATAPVGPAPGPAPAVLTPFTILTPAPEAPKRPMPPARPHPNKLLFPDMKQGFPELKPAFPTLKPVATPPALPAGALKLPMPMKPGD